MQRNIIYILNPFSGTRSKDALKELIQTKTAQAGFHHCFFPSVADGDYFFLHDLIREQGVTDVVIAGGDGTVNGVVRNLKDLPVQFGIIPCGSGNGLALTAGIPKAWGKALTLIFHGKSEWTDAFTINGHFACMLCGLGFDAQVAHHFANDPDRGLKTYIKQSVKHFFKATAYPFMIEVAGKEFNPDAFFISVANSNQFGNNVTIAPKASLSDGLLDVVIVTRQHKLALLLQTVRQIAGLNKLQEIEGVNKKAAVIYFQTDKLTIINSGAAPLHIDGEPVETEPALHIAVLPKCFKLIVP